MSESALATTSLESQDEKTEKLFPEMDRILSEFEDSPLGCGDATENVRMRTEIRNIIYDLCANSDGSFKDVSEEHLDELMRYIVTYGELYGGKETVGDILTKLNNDRLEEVYERTLPYDVNYYVIANSIHPRSDPDFNRPQPGLNFYKEEFVKSGKEHIEPPALFLKRGELADKTENEKLQVVAGTYFELMDENDRNSVLNKLQALRKNDPEDFVSTKLPKATVCVPIAIMGERDEVIERTIDVLSKQKGAEELELVLYANYKPDDSIDEGVLKEKDEMLRSMQERYSLLNIRFVIQGYNDVSISRIRKDYMDVVSLDLYERGAKFNHPVIWLDADTTQMSAGVIQSHIDHHNSVHSAISLASSNVMFNMSDDTSKRVAQTKARGLASYAEIRRRRENRRANKKGYIEESGLSFKIGSYLFAGGVNAATPTNESAWLSINMETYQYNANKVFGEHSPYMDFEKIKSARIITSGRRQAHTAQKYIEFDYSPDREYLYYNHPPENFTGSDNDVRKGEVELPSNTTVGDNNLSMIEYDHIDTIDGAFPHSERDFDKNTRLLELLGIKR